MKKILSAFTIVILATIALVACNSQSDIDKVAHIVNATAEKVSKLSVGDYAVLQATTEEMDSQLEAFVSSTEPFTDQSREALATAMVNLTIAHNKAVSGIDMQSLKSEMISKTVALLDRYDTLGDFLATILSE